MLGSFPANSHVVKRDRITCYVDKLLYYVFVSVCLTQYFELREGVLILSTVRLYRVTTGILLIICNTALFVVRYQTL